MVWDYLAQFWDAVVAVTVGGVEYTVGWFQAIGNAVAGAVGNLFEFLIRGFSDFIVFLGWSGEMLGDIFGAIISPLNFIFLFFKSFFVSLSSSPYVPDFTLFDHRYFDVIPYFSVISGVLAMCFILYITFTAIKHLTHI